jgi:hypothetical protein
MNGLQHFEAMAGDWLLALPQASLGAGSMGYDIRVVHKRGVGAHHEDAANDTNLTSISIQSCGCKLVR